MVSLPPTQLATQTLVQYFIAKIDYMNIQAYLQDDSTNFQWGLHSFAEAFQHFSIRPKIDTLCAYLHKLDLPDLCTILLGFILMIMMTTMMMSMQYFPESYVET